MCSQHVEMPPRYSRIIKSHLACERAVPARRHLLNYVRREAFAVRIKTTFVRPFDCSTMGRPPSSAVRASRLSHSSIIWEAHSTLCDITPRDDHLYDGRDHLHAETHLGLKGVGGEALNQEKGLPLHMIYYFLLTSNDVGRDEDAGLCKTKYRNVPKELRPDRRTSALTSQYSVGRENADRPSEDSDLKWSYDSDENAMFTLVLCEKSHCIRTKLSHISLKQLTVRMSSKKAKKPTTTARAPTKVTFSGFDELEKDIPVYRIFQVRN
ncbi:hypothetical protein EVAR_23216_1 [Eumeta japonica]|uniref:Uncharacterized protein n=1 Tax=Eumeta variegata TaxID=151549 RepID=A0A4C1VFZ4_EUMVA|nr:hypothetical protein EVAR_23216_1 [Eumeta japonica]